MGKRAEAGSSKAIANAIKSKGLGRLRWYCQVCQKQCRDENGFKCHTMSEGHLRQMLVVGESAGKYIGSYSEQFKHDFLLLLSRRWGTKRVRANQVYQEFITDKHHTHMNATRWVTLTEFVKYLGREGIIHADETEKGWYIAWIDNSPKALAKQAAGQARERGDIDDELRQRRMIEEQIAKAKAEKGEGGSGNGSEVGEKEEPERVLQRDEGAAPVTLSFGPPAAPKKAHSPSAASTFASISASTRTSLSTPAPAPVTAKPNVFKLNALKTPSINTSKSNPLKRPPSAGSSVATTGSVAAKKPMSAMEAIMVEDEERKRRRDQATWSGRGGHGREGLQVKRSRVA